MKASIILLLITAGLSSNMPVVSPQETIEISSRITTFEVIPLNYVRIEASKSGSVAYSDSLGRFSITCSSKDVLIFSASGFDNKKIKSRNFENEGINLIFSNRSNSLEEAVNGGHIPQDILEDAISRFPLKGERDYSRYSTIYELIDSEIHNVVVNGSEVITTKVTSFTLSQEVLYVVDGMIVSDISFVVPFNVKSVKYVDGPEASRYGSQGANGAIEIILK